jgi:glycosyltransferase involved in cell wall biosynthesis
VRTRRGADVSSGLRQPYEHRGRCDPIALPPSSTVTTPRTAAAERPRPKVAIAHDYLTQRGGAERVVLAMLRAYPEAVVHTSLYDPQETFPEFRKFRIRTLPLNYVRALRRHHRLAYPLLAPAFSRARIDADVVICSSSGWAHGIRTTGRKVVYCYTPARWLYQTKRYAGSAHTMKSMFLQNAVGATRALLVRWDKRAAASAERYIVMSTAVQQRVRDVYGLSSTILPPPATDLTGLVQQQVIGLTRGFLLCVSRLLPYKNVDLLLAAMSRLPHEKLVVVGTGPEAATLRASAPRNVIFTGAVSDGELAWLYASCRAVIAPSHEDFGLIPIEAAMFGKPAVALAWGGFLDTVVPGRTGVLFEELSADSLACAILSLGCLDIPPAQLQHHAQRYDEAVFAQRLRELVSDALGTVGHD